MTAREVQDYLHISETTFYRLKNEGTLPPASQPSGKKGKLYFVRSQVEAYARGEWKKDEKNSRFRTNPTTRSFAPREFKAASVVQAVMVVSENGIYRRFGDHAFSTAVHHVDL